MLLSVLGATLHWSIQSCRTSIWWFIRLRAGYKIRTKQLGSARTTYRIKTEETDWPEEPGANKLPVSYLFSGSPRKLGTPCLLLRVQQQKTGPRSSWGVAHVSNGLTAQPFQLALSQHLGEL